MKYAIILMILAQQEVKPVPVEITESWFRLFANYGVLGAIVLAIGIFLWRYGSVWGDALVKAHNEFVKKTADTNETNARVNETNARVNSAINDTLRIHSDNLKVLTESQTMQSVRATELLDGQRRQEAAILHLSDAFHDVLNQNDPASIAAKSKIREAQFILKQARTPT